MIKLKKLIKEGSPGFTKREFGDPLPTFKDVMEKHQTVDKETITEASVKTGWKLYKVYDISDKLWMAMKYDLRDQFDELVKIGADYGVFQNAQGTAKILKQIKRLMDKIS
jgi:hypothetical protein